MAKYADKALKLQARRLVHAGKFQKRVVDEFDQRYARYVFGEQYFATEGDRADHYAKMGEHTDQLRIKEGWDTTSFPLHHKLRSVMMPYLLAHDPVFVNRARKGAGPLEVAISELYADVALDIWKESDTTEAVQRALDDAFCYRIGWMRTIFDDQENMPRHEWVDARDMLIDCESRSPRLKDRRWLAHKMVLPIETASDFARKHWDAAKHEFEPVMFDALEDQGGVTARGGARSHSEQPDDAPTEFTRLVMVHVKGQNPYATSARYASRAMNDPTGRDDVYDGKDHILILEAVGGYSNGDGYKFVGRIDWPFPCKRGQFTYTPLVLTKDNSNIYPVSIMQAGHSSQVAADMSLQAYNTDSRLSMRRWVAYDEKAFPDQTGIQRVIEGDVALPAVAVKQGADPSRAIATGNFGSPNQHLMQTFSINRENYEAVQGLNKFDVQVRANQTALNTSIQNESAQVKVDDLSKLVERSIVELAEKGVMCARANMRSDDIAARLVMPAEIEGHGAVLHNQVTSSGKPVESNDLWPDNPDWADIRKEVAVNLEPHSNRFRNPDKEAENIKEIVEYQLQVSRIVGDSVGKGAVMAAKAIAQAANETIKALAKLKNIPNWERFVFDLELITEPSPPPVDPNQMMQSAVEAQGNQINAQQQGAATRLVNQGVSPESLPAQFQG